MSKEKEDFSERVAGPETPVIQETNPWSIKVDDKNIDKDEYKATHDGSKIELATPQLLSLGAFDYNKNLANLQYIIQDIVAGDKEAMNRPEFQALNFPAIKAAIDWLIKTDQLSGQAKADLVTDAWRLNFKVKPPTPEEFLTEKYIGGQAETLYEPVKKVFMEAMDPLAPYRTVVLCPHIGFGKNQPLYSKIYTEKDKFTTFNDINVGDYVLSPDGSKTKVVAIADWPDMDVYELEMDNGKKFQCGLHHLHHVSYRKDENGNKIWDTVETEFLLNHPELDFEFEEVDVSV